MSLREDLLRPCRVHPDRPALWAGGDTLTYAALQAAGALVGALIPPTGGVVVIIGERKLPIYCAIFGCLAAGGTYVPINPKWPIDRILGILATVAADAIILDDGAIRSGLDQVLLARGPHCLQHLQVAADGTATLNPIAPSANHHAPARPFSADGLAYIMFTSGSTGIPKGVPISTDNVRHYVAAMRDIVDLTEQDRFIQNVELTFDLSVHDMLLCWTAGAMLVVVPEASAPLGPRFVRQLNVTCWLSVPSVAAQSKLLGLLKPGAMPSLRWSLFCGEALPTSLARAWQDAAPNARLLNLYGPTEATIAFSAFELRPDATMDQPVVPLGRPIGGQRMAIDDNGELLLSGPQLSAGYLLDPDKTARGFFERDGRRWYRTGDRATVDDTLGFIFKGRLDAQVKVRGYRIELGEVETALRRRAGSDLVAAVPVREVAPGNYEALVAVVCGAAHDPATIIRLIRADLPDYMLPERAIAVATMPRNANDKIDHAALRAMLGSAT